MTKQPIDVEGILELLEQDNIKLSDITITREPGEKRVLVQIGQYYLVHNPLSVKCLRCGFEWQPRVHNPTNCAKCRSPFWSIPRRRNVKPEHQSKNCENT